MNDIRTPPSTDKYRRGFERTFKKLAPAYDLINEEHKKLWEKFKKGRNINGKNQRKIK